MMETLYFKRLKEIRKEAGDTQEQTAKFLGMTQAQYSRYETGDVKISVSVLLRFCKHYVISADYVLGLSDNKLSVNTEAI